ncbi:MAG: pyridoxal-phosphate dependent enzyme, partial [Firmicutes bacterium]|nr:pyridoxal-phosphate dependent enzyme [Bacillota bacterium]
MMDIKERVTELIGSTPLLRLKRMEKKAFVASQIIGKLEYFNPGGSAKDRVGYYMIVDAERQKKLKKNGTIIEPTSGNTGIG